MQKEEKKVSGLYVILLSDMCVHRRPYTQVHMWRGLAVVTAEVQGLSSRILVRSVTAAARRNSRERSAFKCRLVSVVCSSSNCSSSNSSSGIGVSKKVYLKANSSIIVFISINEFWLYQIAIYVINLLSKIK